MELGTRFAAGRPLHRKAVRNCFNVNDNKDLADFTRHDMLDFSRHWLDHIKAGEVTATSASVALIHLGDMLQTVNTIERLRLALPLGERVFREKETQNRPQTMRCYCRFERSVLPWIGPGHTNARARASISGSLIQLYKDVRGVSVMSKQPGFLDLC